MSRPHSLTGWVFGLGCWFACMGCRGAHGGELSTEQLSEVVVREQATLEECYQTSLEKTPYEHEFRIEAKLSIRRDGSVSKVELDQNGLQGMGPCVERTIRTWQFPKAKAETYAGLPIIFRPKVVNTPPENLNLPPGFRVLQDNRPKP